MQRSYFVMLTITTPHLCHSECHLCICNLPSNAGSSTHGEWQISKWVRHTLVVASCITSPAVGAELIWLWEILHITTTCIYWQKDEVLLRDRSKSLDCSLLCRFQYSILFSYFELSYLLKVCKKYVYPLYTGKII